jgi:hypothetical protein
MSYSGSERQAIVEVAIVEVRGYSGDRSDRSSK